MLQQVTLGLPAVHVRAWWVLVLSKAIRLWFSCGAAKIALRENSMRYLSLHPPEFVLSPARFLICFLERMILQPFDGILRCPARLPVRSSRSRIQLSLYSAGAARSPESCSSAGERSSSIDLITFGVFNPCDTGSALRIYHRLYLLQLAGSALPQLCT